MENKMDKEYHENWTRATKLHLNEMTLTSSILWRPDMPVGLQFVFPASDPAAGNYEVLFNHVVVYRSPRVDEAIGVYLDPQKSIDDFYKVNGVSDENLS
jgi:hypothetical protein